MSNRPWLNVGLGREVERIMNDRTNSGDVWVQMLVATKRDEAGGVRKLARKWRLSAAYVSDVILGRRLAGPSILKHLKLRRVTTVTRHYVSSGQRGSVPRPKGER